MTHSIVVRNLDDKVAFCLKSLAKKEGVSMNSLVLKIINRALGLEKGLCKTPIHNDLDYLAGTWNKNDLKEFNKNTAFFETIDQEIWQP